MIFNKNTIKAEKLMMGEEIKAKVLLIILALLIYNR